MKVQSNKLDFKGQNIYAGFDTHKKNWTVTILTENLTHKTFSQDPNPEKLYQYLVKNFPGGTYHTAYEAGFCGYWIHNKLKSLGVNSIVVNPADVPTTDKEKDSKDDPIDSRKIAKSLRNNELTPIYVPSLKNLEDRNLLRIRASIVKDITRDKNQIKSFLYFHGIESPEAFFNRNDRWSKRFIIWLESIQTNENTGTISLKSLITKLKNNRELLLKITKAIKELSKSEFYKDNYEFLTSIPGIGLINSMVILTEFDTINRFKKFDSLSRYIGFVPSIHSSSDKKKVGPISHRGNKILKKALIESAWIAARIDPALNKSYNVYCKRMKPNEAIIRIAKKLLSRINYVLKNRKKYECKIVK